MDTAPLALELPGRALAAGRGWHWIPAGWALFTRAPLMWVVTIVLLLVVALVMGLVPIIGNIAFQLLTPVFAAGLVHACRALETGGDFEIDTLLTGFRERFVPLVTLGAIFTVAGLVIILLMAGIMGFSVLGAVMSQAGTEEALATLAGSMMGILLGALVGLALAVPLMAAWWFAPALVAMHGLAPVDAMKASFFGCLRNIVPFLLYSIVMTVLAVVAMIPFGLGFLVWLPVAITSTYVSYREIYTAERPAAAPKPAMV